MFIANADISTAFKTHLAPATALCLAACYLKNGTVYTIDLSRVSKIRDRNGNFTSFQFVTDTRLPNQITIPWAARSRFFTIRAILNNPDDRADIITYHGFQGAPRTIQVLRRALHSRLRPGSVRRPASLRRAIT